MAKFITVVNTTSKIIHLFVQSAGATNGVGFTGLSFSASGLQMAYIRAGSSAHSVVTLTGSGLNLGTYVSGALLQVSSGTMPGVYEFHIPNAALTTQGTVAFILQGNASIAPTPFEVQVDPPNGIFTPILAATTHSGATIPIVSTVSILADKTGYILAATTHSGATIPVVISVNTATVALNVSGTVAGSVGSVTGNVSGTVANVTLVANVNTLTTLLGGVTVIAYTASKDPAFYILANTGNKLVTDASGFVTVGTNNDKTGYILAATTHSGATIPIVLDIAGTVAGSVGSVTGNVSGTVANVTLVANVNTVTNIINSVTVGAYAASKDPAFYVLSTTGSKLFIDASGFVTVGTNSDKTDYILAATTHSGATIPVVINVNSATNVGTVGIVNTVGTGAIGATAFIADAISTAFAQAAADKVFGSGGASLAELSQAIPPTTPRPDQAIMALYMAMRNVVVVNSTEMRIANNAGTVIFKKALTDDGTTYTEAQAVAGP